VVLADVEDAEALGVGAGGTEAGERRVSRIVLAGDKHDITG
jgi:hypothetical protein